MKKHIVCLGDSNTHGYCADSTDCADGGNRFNEEERWTMRLAKLLGEDYLVLEEGLGGRTTVFSDPLHEGMSALDVAYPLLMTHEPVSLLIIMLGTNDTKERFGANAPCIALGMERLVQKIKTIPCWEGGKPNILIVCPPHIHDDFQRLSVSPPMGNGCPEKSRELARWLKPVAEANGCAFLDAEGIAAFNQVDFMHLTRAGHQALAQALAEKVPALLYARCSE